MKLNRAFLYGGLFLLALGVVLVLADTDAVDTAALADAVRLWPLVPLAIGAAIVVRRTQLSLAGGMFAAAVPGLVLGGAIAVVPRFVGDCGARGDPATTATQQGTFERSASVSVKTGCGSLSIGTAAGSGWQLAAGNTAGHAPIVESSGESLSIFEPSENWNVLSAGRDRWSLTIPIEPIDALSVVAFANHSQLALAGAQIRRLDLTVNASEMVVDASAASIVNLSGVVNIGLLSIHLPANSNLDGSLRIGGGELQICSPPELGLRVTTTGAPKEINAEGRDQVRPGWQTANYESAAHHADLEITAHFGAIKINPIGGCR